MNTAAPAAPAAASGTPAAVVPSATSLLIHVKWPGIVIAFVGAAVIITCGTRYSLQ